MAQPLQLVKAATGPEVRTRALAFLDTLARQNQSLQLRQDEQYDAMADVVFAYWQAKLGHPHSRFDPKRRRYIVARLRETKGDLGLLLYATDGAKRDDFLAGRDLRSTRRYDGISTIYRDLEQVERLAEMCPGYRKDTQHPLITKYSNGNGHAAQ